MGNILLILIIVTGIILYTLYVLVADKIRILFGYKKYEYTKILSYGMKDEFMWHKTDEKALEHYKHFEFVSEVRPNKRRLRPLN
jgi:hypothetical protein